MGKQFNIKDAETIRLARELAGQLGSSVTSAIRQAVQEKLDLGAKGRAKPSTDELLEMFEGLRSRWKPEYDGQQLSLTHGDLLYDELGLPE